MPSDTMLRARGGVVGRCGGADGEMSATVVSEMHNTILAGNVLVRTTGLLGGVAQSKNGNEFS